MKTFHIYLLPGDGIGPEIAEQAKKIFKVLRERGAADLRVKEGVIGGASVDLHGVPLTSETLKTAQRSDAVLMGAVGGPKWDTAPREVRPERGLLAIRKEMGLFANLRPAVVFDELAEASSLKTELVKGLDILIVRELTGDLYFGQPRGVEELPDGQKRGFNTMVYTTSEIRRIAEAAFEAALKRGGRVCSIDKANVLECTELWRQEVTALHAERYAGRVELSHMYVDNAAMQLVRYPRQFDVMLTGNMFGDILSDCASMLTGSLGMLPSASLGEPGKPGLYEPVHGSAPDIAGRNIANPMAMILSAAMMMRYSLGLDAVADATETAVRKTLAKGLRTHDIACGGEAVTTDQAGDEIAAELNRILRGF